MEWLIGIGIIWLIGYLMGGSNKAEESTIRTKIRAELEGLATKNQSLAKGILFAANHVSATPATTTIATAEPPVTPAKTTVASEETGWLSKDIKAPDSITVLLYLGAFLMIAGVGLFVGLSDFSGATKTVAVALLGLTFYLSGLAMYAYVERLKPAAAAFVAIGLISLPLAGVALYNFVTHGNGAAIWFVTSALCMILYAVALWLMRQSFIGYLSVFMFVSVWLSTVAVIDAPFYLFGWALVILGMIYLVAAKTWRLWREIEAPLNTSAAIMVPAAVFVTLFLAHNDVNQLHQGVTLLLAAAFYGLASWFDTKPNNRLAYLIVATILPAVGAALIAYHFTDKFALAALAMNITTLVMLAGTLLLRSRLPANWSASLQTTSAIVLAAAAATACLLGNDTKLASLLLGINLLAHCGVGLYLRDRLHMVLAFIVVLVLPWTFITGVLTLHEDTGKALTITYLALGAAMLGVSLVIGRLLADYRYMSLATMPLALVLGAAFGLFQPDWWPVVGFGTAGTVLLAATYINKQAGWIYPSLFMLACTACLAIAEVTTLTPLKTTALLASMAGAYYLIGTFYRLTGQKHLRRFSLAWRISALVLFYGAAIITGFGYDRSVASAETLRAVVLMLAGSLTAYEAFLAKSRLGVYIGGAIALAAIQWLMHQQDITNFQIYSHMWAAYFGVLAWLSHHRGRDSSAKSFTVVALCCQTLPLASEALAGEAGYGLLLLLESIGILLVGLWIRYRLLTVWGLAAAVGSVLYQLRDFQFFVLLLLGGGIIALGVFLLLKKK